MTRVDQNPDDQKKQTYDKPCLTEFGGLLQNTKTDPAATMGPDISQMIMAWGDPS